jgi:hypothetical protein
MDPKNPLKLAEEDPTDNLETKLGDFSLFYIEL